MTTPAGTERTIQIAGESVPVSATFVLPAASVAIRYLAGHDVTATPDATVWTTPAGRLLLDGFTPPELEAITEHFQLVAASRHLGLARVPTIPVRPVERGNRHAVPNPVLTLVTGIVILTGGVIATLVALFGPLRVGSNGDEVVWIYVILFALIAALGLVPIVYSVPRVRWWLRARAEYRRRGRPLPWALRAF